MLDDTQARIANYRAGTHAEQPCPVCGAERTSKVFKFMEECSDECFTKAFWADKLQWHADGDVTPDGAYTIRVNGEHYVAGLEAGIVRTHNRFVGFGGAVWYVLFTAGPHVGKLRVTNNMWCQGEIRAEYREQLPDNAVFLQKEEFFRLILDYREHYDGKVFDHREFSGPFTAE